MSNNYVTEKAEIGRGAFSFVYKGYNKNSPEVTLAVKVLNLKGLLGQYGNTYRKYLQREIDAMKMLRNHPNIVCLNDVEYLGDYVYIGMEYCESDLKQYLHDKKTNKDKLLSEEEAQSFMRQIANGLKFMGGQAIAHRDLKPQNILMSSLNGHAILKIADFGFARTMAKDSVNMNASHCGTPLYMAPEVQKQVYSDTCDLWSLGIILFEMMFGFTKLRHCKHIIDVGGISPLLPKTLSPNCTKLFEDLLQVDPAKRIPWIDFFNHPFLYEPHPEVSLLKPAEPNAVQVFSFPSLQAFSLVLLDEDETINQWKIANGLDENCIAVLCRDTETNRPDEISKWSGVEMRDYQSIGFYQIGSMGTSNQCIFIFNNQEAASAKLLLDAHLRAGPKIEKPSVEDPELYLKQCRDAVSALYEDLVYVYDACSKYVLTRELLRYGNRAIRAASKTTRENLEVEYQKLGNLLEPAEADWKRTIATYTERKSAIEMFPALALPAFLRPTTSSVDNLVVTKQNEIDAIKAQLIQINTAFGKAKAAMNSWRPSTLLSFIEGEYKELLNGKMYEFKRNVSHFLSMLETTKVTPQTEVERAGGKVEEPIEVVKSRILLEYSLDLNRRVREFYERLLTTFQDTDELMDQTKKAVEYHKLLTRMQGDDVDMSVAESLPSLTREALAFKNAVQPICKYVDLPSVVNQFVRLLHARQKYERQIRNLKTKADVMLTNLYARHQDNLENFFQKHEQQLAVLFPNFAQISALPLSSVSLFPLPSLCDYSDIPPFSSISSPIQDGSEFDLEDEFSMIVKEGTTISSLLHDTARLASQLREVEREKERQNKKEEENSGELAHRVRLYERMITLKNEQGGKEMANENQALREQLKLTTEDLVNTTKELEEAQKQKPPPRDANYDFELRAKLRVEWEKEVQEKEQTRKTEKEGAEELIQAMNHTIDQLTRENGEQKTMLAVEIAKLEEERDRVEGERENLQNAQKRLHDEDKELRAQLEAMRKQLATQAQENANEAQELRAQNDAMRTQLSAAQSDVQIARERVASLELQQTELRDEVMAYKLAYAMDGIALPVQQPPEARPNLE